ncbi:MAG: hypothetical protein ACKO3W_03910, partial [bacterium]
MRDRAASRFQPVADASERAVSRRLPAARRGFRPLSEASLMRELWAEFLGRGTGTCKGKGGP